MDLNGLPGLITAAGRAHATRMCVAVTDDVEYLRTRLAALVGDIPLYEFTFLDRRQHNPQRKRWEVIGTSKGDPREVIAALEEVRGPALVILLEVMQLIADKATDPRPRLQLLRLLAEPVAGSAGRVLVFVEGAPDRSQPPSILDGRVVRLDVPRPREDELRPMILAHLGAEVTSRRQSPEVLRVLAPRYAAALAGLPFTRARDLLTDAVVTHPGHLDHALAAIETVKGRQLEETLHMDRLDPTAAEPVFGLDHLTRFVDAARPRLLDGGRTRPRGLLLVGPPGVGKTAVAQAIGASLEIPVIRFALERLQSELFGRSESNLAKALSSIAAMAPVVLFIDEWDKAFSTGRGEEDGGVRVRMLGMLLAWLSDANAPVYVVGTSNSLTRLGADGLALARPGRLDAIFFVDVPARPARRAMLAHWLHGHVEDPEAVAEIVAADTARFSGADLRGMVQEAVRTAAAVGGSVTLDALLALAEQHRMRAVMTYSEFDALRRWGRQFARPAGPTDDDLAQTTAGNLSEIHEEVFP